MNICELIVKVLVDRKTCLDWCFNANLFERSRECHICKSEMILNYESGVAGRLRCSKYSKHTKYGKRVLVERYVSEKSWFVGCKLPIERILLLFFCWAEKYSYDQTISTSRFLSRITVSHETVSDYFSYFRELSMILLDEIYCEKGKIGGPGCLVEIDESKIGKRKYNRGRMVEGSWLLGFIEINEQEKVTAFRLEICPANKRDKKTLIPLIKKHVRTGTLIRTDCWKAYDSLTECGYEHETVNHSENFVDPATGAHTQTIESNWRPLKKRLNRGGVHKDKLAEHLCEYLWRWEIKRKEKTPFEEMLNGIASIDWK